MNEDNQVTDPPIAFSSKVILFCLGCVIIIGGYLMSLQARPAYEKQRAAYESFLDVEAKVLESKVITSSTRENLLRYSPYIKYSYTAQGRSYITDRYNFQGLVTDDIESIQSLINQYKTGSFVKAYYNPEKPVEAVLNNDPPFYFSFHYFGYLIGGLFALSAFFPSLFKTFY